MSNIKETVATPVDLEANTRSQYVTVAVPQSNVRISNNIIQKCETYNRSRGVKFISIIDIIFLIINFIVSLLSNFISYFTLILLPLCYFGYKGANEYKRGYLIGYIFYLMLMAISYTIIAFYYGYIFYILLTFIELYFLHYTIRLYKLIGSLPESDKNSLREGYVPENVIVYYY